MPGKLFAGKVNVTSTNPPDAAATLIPLSFTLRPAPAAERAAQASRQANYLPRHVTLIALPIAVLGCCTGLGLVAGIQVVKPGTRTPDPDLATRINVACMHRGLLMFAPVGVGGECVKISPPLSIEDDCLRESLAVCE